jgi:3-methyladenine DNA glycosylase AlkD
MPKELTAKEFVARLTKHQSDAELKKIQRYFKAGEGEYGHGDKFMGVRMGQVFALAKEFMFMEPAEIEKLLQHPIHEVRAGALRLMADQAGSKKTSPQRLQELYELFMRNLNYINNWDLVDLAAHQVVGRYLSDKPRKPLYKLAGSKSLWERRIAMFATFHFVRKGDLDDGFAIAEILVNDKEDLIHKVVGGMLRAMDGHDPKRVRRFLDAHAASMPRTALRYAMEHFPKKERERYMAMGAK